MSDATSGSFNISLQLSPGILMGIKHDGKQEKKKNIFTTNVFFLDTCVTHYSQNFSFVCGICLFLCFVLFVAFACFFVLFHTFATNMDTKLSQVLMERDGMKCLDKYVFGFFHNKHIVNIENAKLHMIS